MTRTLLFTAAACAILLASCGKKDTNTMAARDVSYSDGTTELRGYVVYNSATHDKRPGVLVVPEWWGVVEYPKMRARMLADLGYVAMVADMFGNGKTAATPDSAMAYVTTVMKDPEQMRARFLAAYDLLKHEPTCDSTRIAAIGFCFGGSVALQMARAGIPLAGVVAFHPGLANATPAQPQPTQTKVLVLNGAADPTNPPEVVTAFKRQMDSAHVDYQFIDFPDAKHSFTNPASDSIGRQFNMPVAYNRDADRGSWTDMREFLHQVFSEKKLTRSTTQ